MTTESDIQISDADKSKSRGKSADMSPAAVTRRLEICGDLSDACRELAQAKPLQSSPSNAGGHP